MRHKCDSSATRTIRLRLECYTNDTRATRVKNFHFNSDTSKNIFLHPYIYYMALERLQWEEQFHSKNCLLEIPCFHSKKYLLEIPCFHAKMHLKSAPQKLDLLMAKSISKSCTLDCSCKYPCTFLHSYAQ